jgi:hypothetical protein
MTGGFAKVSSIAFRERLPRIIPHLPFLWLFLEIAFTLFRAGNRGLYGDHHYYLAHLLSNRIYFQKNGFFELPYYTPAFAGGLPQYANPQDMWFSMVQWLFNLTPNPMMGYRFAFVFGLLLAYAGCYRLFRRLDLSRWIAATGAFVFSLNGYWMLQSVVGQVNMHAYWTIPWILLHVLAWYQARTWRTALARVVAAALLFSTFVYGACTFIFIFSAALSVTLVAALMVSRYRGPAPRPLTWIVSVGLCGSLFGILSASKLTASFDYMRQFGRVYSNEDMGLQRALWLIPNGLFNFATNVGTMLPMQLYGYYETCAYVGATCAVILLIGLAIHLWREPQRSASDSAVTLRFFLAWAVIGTVTAGYLYIGWNPGWYVLKRLPVFESLHVPTRFIGIMPVFLVGLAAAFLNDWYKSGRKSRLVALLCSVWVLEIVGYYAFNIKIWTYSDETKGPKSVQDFQIKGWAHSNTGPETLASGLSDVLTYEALFGAYDRSAIKTKVVEDKAPGARLPNGDYNLNDPQAMIYSKEVGREPWSLLPGDTPQDKVDRFLAFQNPGFFIPFRQHAANAISALAWAVSLGWLGWMWRLGRRERRQGQRVRAGAR